MKRVRQVRREEKVTLEVSEVEVREALKPLLERNGVDLPKHGVSIYVRVPGGGDWSNMDLELDRDTPLYINFTKVDDDDDEDTLEE